MALRREQAQLEAHNLILLIGGQAGPLRVSSGCVVGLVHRLRVSLRGLLFGGIGVIVSRPSHITR